MILAVCLFQAPETKCLRQHHIDRDHSKCSNQETACIEIRIILLHRCLRLRIERNCSLQRRLCGLCEEWTGCLLARAVAKHIRVRTVLTSPRSRLHGKAKCLTSKTFFYRWILCEWLSAYLLLICSVRKEKLWVNFLYVLDAESEIFGRHHRN